MVTINARWLILLDNDPCEGHLPISTLSYSRYTPYSNVPHKSTQNPLPFQMYLLVRSSSTCTTAQGGNNTEERTLPRLLPDAPSDGLRSHVLTINLLLARHRNSSQQPSASGRRPLASVPGRRDTRTRHPCRLRLDIRGSVDTYDRPHPSSGTHSTVSSSLPD